MLPNPRFERCTGLQVCTCNAQGRRTCLEAQLDALPWRAKRHQTAILGSAGAHPGGEGKPVRRTNGQGGCRRDQQARAAIERRRGTDGAGGNWTRVRLDGFGNAAGGVAHDPIGVKMQHKGLRSVISGKRIGRCGRLRIAPLHDDGIGSRIGVDLRQLDPNGRKFIRGIK